MKPKYRCLICGEVYGSHITAIHNTIKLYFAIKKNVDGEINYGFSDESLLIENN